MTATSAELHTHPWNVRGTPRATYARHLVASNFTDTFVLVGGALALFGHGWWFLVLAAAIGSDYYSCRARKAAWAQLPTQSPGPTPAAVAALHGLATFTLFLAVAAALSGCGELGAFLTALIGTFSLVSATVHLVRRTSSGVPAAVLGAVFSFSSAAACFVLLLTRSWT
jgi:hypothetical protein